MFPTHLNPNNILFYITSNFTPIHVYPPPPPALMSHNAQFPLCISKGCMYVYEMCLQEILVVVFIKTNVQSKMMNTTTMIHCRRISKRELDIEGRFLLIDIMAKIFIYNVCMVTCSRMPSVQPNGPLRFLRTSVLERVTSADNHRLF